MIGGTFGTSVLFFACGLWNNIFLLKILNLTDDLFVARVTNRKWLGVDSRKVSMISGEGKEGLSRGMLQR